MTIRMLNLLWVAIFVMCVSACSRESPPADVRVGDNPPVPDAAYVASPGWEPANAGELEAESTKAIEGDAAAAGRVAGYYGLVESGSKTALFWMRVAAENSNVGWMKLYAAQLAIDGAGDTHHCKRAIYWIRRADALQTDPKPNIERDIQGITGMPQCSSLQTAVSVRKETPR
jgi:hypothetical protein